MSTHAEVMKKAPFVLLPYQQKWVADPSPVKVHEKSRRIGLSWSEAADAVLSASGREGQDVWYIGYNKDMAGEFIRDVSDWAAYFRLVATAVEEELFADGDDGKRSILGFKVTFASGFRVVALTSRPSNLRGKQGTVVIDEAAFHGDLAGLLKAAIALLMWGGRVRIISTHDGDLNPFNALVEEIRQGKKPYSLHRTSLDDALADGLFKRICLVSGQDWSPEAEARWRQDLLDFYGDDADEELMVVPSSGTGAYLPRSLIEACMEGGRPVLALALPDDFATQDETERQAHLDAWIESHLVPLTASLNPGARHFLGEDFGRTSDLSVLVPLAENPDLSLDVPFMVELRNVPFDQQRQLVLWLLARLPQFTRAAFDAGGNGAYLAEVAQQAFGAWRVEALHLNEPWYREHMPRFKAGLQSGRLHIPRHADVLRDLRAIELVRGVPRVPSDKRFVGSDGKPRHADAAIALALGYYAATQEGEPAAAGTDTAQADHGNPYHAARSGRARR